MFLTAVARPRFDSAKNVTFSGKIGVWPFVKEMPAQRKSGNRPKGTLETKNVKVDRDLMREFLIEKVLPAIRAAWPVEDAGQTIFIQQDNAKPHILPNDPAFKEAVANIGMDIRLVQQPANSPDLNVLDLGFFNSIQSLTDCRSPRTLQDLIRDVQEEFAGYNASTLNKIFLSLQACMTEVLNHRGGNGYSIPHANKTRLEALKILPTSIACPLEVFQNALKAQAEVEQAQEEAKKAEAAKKAEVAKQAEAAKQAQEEAKKAEVEAKKAEAKQAHAAKKAETEAKKAEAEAKKAEAKQAQEAKKAEAEAKKAEAEAKKAEAKQAQEAKKAEAEAKKAEAEAKKAEAKQAQEAKKAEAEAKKAEAEAKKAEAKQVHAAKKAEAEAKKAEAEAKKAEAKQVHAAKKAEAEAKKAEAKQLQAAKKAEAEAKKAEAAKHRKRKRIEVEQVEAPAQVDTVEVATTEASTSNKRRQHKLNQAHAIPTSQVATKMALCV
nr:uncharacterized protein LOC127299597 [Lolium perenne]